MYLLLRDVINCPFKRGCPLLEGLKRYKIQTLLFREAVSCLFSQWVPSSTVEDDPPNYRPLTFDRSLSRNL